MFCMVVLIFGQVLNRFIFKLPLAWLEELSRYIMIWMVFVGSVIATREDVHARITFVEDKFPEKGKRILKVIQNAVVVAFLVIILVSSLQIIATQMQIGRHSPALEISMWIIYLAIPLWAVMQLLDIFYYGIKGLRENKAGTGKDGE